MSRVTVDLTLYYLDLGGGGDKRALNRTPLRSYINYEPRGFNKLEAGSD